MPALAVVDCCESCFPAADSAAWRAPRFGSASDRIVSWAWLRAATALAASGALRTESAAFWSSFVRASFLPAGSLLLLAAICLEIASTFSAACSWAAAAARC